MNVCDKKVRQTTNKTVFDDSQYIVKNCLRFGNQNPFSTIK